MKNNLNIKDPVSVYNYIYDPEETPGYLKNIDINNLPKPDFPHDLHHSVTVRNFARALGLNAKLEIELINKLEKAAILHDIGQGYTIPGTVTVSEHAVASGIIAFMITGDEDLTDIMDQHPYMGLSRSSEPTELDKATDILIYADRLANMGYAGLIRLAYYHGFRSPLMNLNQDTIIEQEILCDTRCDITGLPQDYENKVREFCLKEVFSYLIDHNLLSNVLNHSNTNRKRFLDIEELEDRFAEKLKEKLRGNDDIDFQRYMMNYPRNEISQTSLNHQWLFYKKYMLESEIINICEHIIFLQHSGSSTNIPEYLQERLNWSYFKID